jgi:hypothetical protein
LQQEESRACDPLEWVDLSREYFIEDDVEPELEWSSSEAWLKRNMARSNDEHNVEKKDWDTKAERAREERGWFDNNTGRYHKFQPGSKVTEKVKEQHRRSHQGREWCCYYKRGKCHFEWDCMFAHEAPTVIIEVR